MASIKELANQAKNSRLGTAISNVLSQSKSNLSNNVSNFKGNVQAISSPQTRETWFKGAPVTNFAFNAGKAFTQAPQALGRGLGTAITAPMNYLYERQNRQIDERLNQTLRNQASRQLKGGNIDASRRISDLLADNQQRQGQRQIGFGENLNQARKEAVSGTIGTLIQLLGAKGLTPSAIAGYGGASAVLGGLANKVNGGSFSQGAGEGFGKTLQFRGVNKLTQPGLDKLGKIVSPTKRLFAGIGANAVGNVIEDEILTRGSEGRGQTKEEIATSAFIGGAIGGATNLKLPEKQSKQLRDALGRFTQQAQAKIRGLADLPPKLRKQVLETEFMRSRQNPKWVQTATGLKKVYGGQEAYGAMAGIEPEYDEEGRLTGVGFNSNKAAAGLAIMGGVKAVKNGNLKFDGNYQRGDIKTLQNRLDELLGTKSFNNTGKWQADLPARQTAKRQLESFAQDGDVDAQQYLKQVNDLENEIANATFSKDQAIKSKIQVGVQPTKGVDPLAQEARKYKTADEWMSAKMKDDTTGALGNPDIRVMLTNEWNRLVGNGATNQKINKIPEQTIISRQKLELIPGDKNSAKIDLIHTKNGWTPRIPDTDINPTGMIYPTKYSAETSIRNDYKSGKLVYNTSKAPTGDYPSVMAGNHVKQVSKSGAFLVGSNPQPTKGVEAPEVPKAVNRQEPGQTKTTPYPQTTSGGSSSRLRTGESAQQEQISQLRQGLGKNLESLSDSRGQVDRVSLSKAVKSNTESLKLSSSDGIIPPNVEQEIRNTQRAVDKKVNLLDYMRTPDRVLKKIGLEKEAKLIRQQYNRYLDELPKEIDKVTQWYNRVKNNPEAEVRIFRYLDGQKQQLPPEELKVAKEIQAYLQNWADKLDLPQDKRIASYITHIFENDFIQKEFDPDVAKIIAGKLPGSVYDPFLQKRLGEQGYVEDVFRALDAYVKRATRKVNMDPALKQLESQESKLDLASWDYVKNYTDRINLRPTDWDELLDNAIKQSPIGYKFGQRPVTALSKSIRQMVYRGTLGLNVGSAIRNLTQGVNTYSQLGEKYTSVGLMKALRSVVSRDSELADVGVLRNTLIEDRTLSSTKKFWENMDKGLFFLFEAAEKLNRGTAYYGAKSRALSQGKTEKEAIEAGLEMARKTQFTFGSVDTPVALQSDLVKLATQFQSYNVKQTEFLAEMVKNKEFLGVARWLGANAIILTTVGQAMGWDWKDFVPFGGVLEGKSPIGTSPFFQLASNVGKIASGGKDQYGQPVDGYDVADSAIPFIPGGVQLFNKTVPGLSDVSNGYAQGGYGTEKLADLFLGRERNIKFPIEQTPGNYVKASLFGTSKLPASQEYKKNERSVLGKNQSTVLKSLSRPQQQEYYNAVIAKREADKAETKQIQDIKSGNTKIQTSTNEKVIKAKLEANLPVNDDELSQVYLSKTLKLPKSNRYEKSQRDSSLYSSYSTIQSNEDLSGEQKQVLASRIAQELGKTPQDLQTYSVAKEDNDSKTLYAYDQFDKMGSFDDRMRYLVNGRKPINGKILVSDGVIDNLVADGLIPKALGDDIKDIDLNEDGTLKKGKIKGKSGKAANTARNKAINDAFEDLKKIKIGSSKIKTTASERINTKGLTFSGA